MQLRIISLQGGLFEGNVESLNCPTEVGDITVLDHHRPLITILKKGSATVLDAEKKEQVFSFDGGFLEVSPQNTATLLMNLSHTASAS